MIPHLIFKRCSKCKKEKKSTEFPKNKKEKSGLACWCKECFHKNYQKTKSPLINRKRRLKTRFNLDIEKYEEMKCKQNNLCAICGEKEIGRYKVLCIDHDHKTGKVRDLLCQNCNHLLGHAKENILILLKAINYLKKFNEKNHEN